jgi:hypothetical protein
MAFGVILVQLEVDKMTQGVIFFKQMFKKVGCGHFGGKEGIQYLSQTTSLVTLNKSVEKCLTDACVPESSTLKT